ncbi:hypothetical protein EDB19DRAFT_1750006 [Suillus lakei]|nr:hypothetical protein EDB19DRAFT_1750006 [Suillus lakei]
MLTVVLTVVRLDGHEVMIRCAYKQVRYSCYFQFSQHRMASESELPTLHVEGGAHQEGKARSETSEGSHVAKDRDPPSSPPGFLEGGLAGWATAFGAFLVQFCAFGYTSSFGVYQGIAADASEHVTFNILPSRLLYTTLPDE